MNQQPILLRIAISCLALACKPTLNSSDGSDLAATGSPRVQNPMLGQINQGISGLIKYLQDKQVKPDQANGEYKLAGEWGSEMIYRKENVLMNWLTTKVGTSAYDSNCFETSSTAIILADTYTAYKDIDPENAKKIVPMLDLAMDKILKCKVDSGGFAFWPEIEMPQKFKYDDTEGTVPTRIRGPKSFPYTSYDGQLQNNNPADVDDTGLAFQALLKYTKITEHMAGKKSYAKVIGEQIANKYDIYSHHEDGPRTAKFAYDGAEGAFLVWWGNKSTKFLGLGDTNPTMPMNFNVIDCVGNTNALGALSLKNEKWDRKGYDNTCGHVNKMVRDHLDKECGLYYPSPYNLHHAIGSAIHNGTSCLEVSRAALVKDIEDTQLPDGSWPPYDNDERDRIQTAIFALSAYLKLVPKEAFKSEKVKNVVYNSLKYLFVHHVGGSTDFFWEPGIHFSSGPAFLTRDGLRGTIIWKSHGFTNAMMLETLYAVRTIYKEDLEGVTSH